MPTSETATRATSADAVGPGGDVDQAVVVDQRDEEHQHDADGEEADLLVVEAVELGRAAVADLISSTLMSESRSDEAEEDPVEIAEARTKFMRLA